MELDLRNSRPVSMSWISLSAGCSAWSHHHWQLYRSLHESGELSQGVWVSEASGHGDGVDYRRELVS